MSATANHIGLFSENRSELVRFYVEKLGFEEGETRDLSPDLVGEIFGFPAGCTMTKLLLGEIVLEIFTPKSGPLAHRLFNTRGYNHWGLKVPDKEDFVKEAEGRGVDVARISYKDRMIIFIRDPEGNLIEVFEDKKKT